MSRQPESYVKLIATYNVQPSHPRLILIWKWTPHNVAEASKPRTWPCLRLCLFCTCWVSSEAFAEQGHALVFWSPARFQANIAWTTGGKILSKHHRHLQLALPILLGAGYDSNSRLFQLALDGYIYWLLRGTSSDSASHDLWRSCGWVVYS